MLRSGRRRAAAFFLVFAFALGPLRASAQSADELIEEGRGLRAQDRDAEALERFERAYEMARSARALAQIALAEQALGRWVDAEGHLVEVLAMSDPYVIENRAMFDQALATVRERVGRLELAGGVPGAVVRVSDIERGTLPLVSCL